MPGEHKQAFTGRHLVNVRLTRPGSEKITRHELGAALGIDRFAVDELLNRCGVTEDLPTARTLYARYIGM